MISGLFNFTGESRSVVTSSEPSAEIFNIGASTESGETVNGDTAMRLAAVYSSIYVLSSSLAQLPLHVMRRHKGKVEQAKDHPAYYLLHDQPETWQTSYQYRETGMQHVLASGNSVAHIKRNRKGELLELTQVNPEHFAEPQRVNGTNRWLYPTWDEYDTRQKYLMPEQVVHIQAFSKNKRWGMSPIAYNAETIGQGLAAKKYGSQFFGSGGRPNGILINKSSLKDDGQKNLKAAWKAGGIGKGGGRTALLHGDIDYKPITITPEEAQFLETQKFNRSEIAGIYNVPSHMINDLEKATFSNISEQAIQFVRHSMMPWIARWEQEFNRKIFTENERRAGYYTKFNLTGLLRGTPKERAEYYHYAITDGWMDRNEARSFEDMNPRDGLSEMLISVNAQKPAEIGKEEGQKDG